MNNKCFLKIGSLLVVLVSLNLTACNFDEASGTASGGSVTAMTAPEHIYLGTDKGLFESIDGGSVFVRRSGGDVRSLAVENGLILVSFSDNTISTTTLAGGWSGLEGAPGAYGARSVAIVNGTAYVTGQRDFGHSTDFIGYSRSQNPLTTLGSTWGSGDLKVATGFNGHAFAGSGDKGLFFYIDGNYTDAVWFERAPLGIPSNNVLSLDVDPSRSLIYVGTDNGLATATFNTSSGIRNTWRVISSNPGFAQSPYIRDLDVYGDAVCAATDGGLSISNDAGDTWRTTTSGMNGFVATDAITSCAVKGRFVLAGSDEGVSYSSDSGATWVTIRASERGLTTNRINQVAFDRDLKK